MKKNELMIFEKKEKIESKNFLDFLLDYKKINEEKSKREDVKAVVIFELARLLFGELFIYYKDFEMNIKFMTMLMIFSLGVMTFGKEILNLLSNMTSKRAFKEEIKLMEEKTEDWLEILSNKEKKYEIAQKLIKRIEYLEKSIIKNKQKELNELKNNIYHIFSEEIKENRFNVILEEMKKIEFYEKHLEMKEREEENLQKIKNEIDGVKTVKLSDSFIKNGKSFN